ncbi:DUF3574 domain-containing protein [Amycolatopsis sp. CA-230715]|uniref:DUF3574 domain-containing protein n=1 Tax=Amycolatopsis sp. CA-230715 TaxID=2745196 RepID=UPI001C02C03A|nr:DUF3574 domain-containing protein [Amycolatopsis sp. CA-230715]QWF82438.1 hypothetical protein HUW46_05875 [Amycolatopsis sp. CA-230715]
MEKSRRTASAAAAALVIGLGGGVASASATAQPATEPAAAVGTPSKRTELYFGTEKPTGGVVTPEDFENFVDKEITPAFPDGLTKFTATGQWKRGAEIVKETTYVVVLFYPLGNRKADGEIEEIRADYKKFFDQDSVARADDTQRVSF